MCSLPRCRYCVPLSTFTETRPTSSSRLLTRSSLHTNCTDMYSVHHTLGPPCTQTVQTCTVYTIHQVLPVHKLYRHVQCTPYTRSYLYTNSTDIYTLHKVLPVQKQYRHVLCTPYTRSSLYANSTDIVTIHQVLSEVVRSDN